MKALERGEVFLGCIVFKNEQENRVILRFSLLKMHPSEEALPSMLGIHLQDITDLGDLYDRI